MSDYLTNLAARTLAAPSLRPRLRMRFEPEAGEGDGDGELTPIADETTAPVTRADMTEAPVREPRRVAPRGEVAREVPVAPTRAAEEATQPTAVAPAPRAGQAPQTRVIERVRERVERIETRSEATTRVETREEAAEPEPPPPHRHDLEEPRVVRASGLPLTETTKTEGRPEARTTPRTNRVLPEPAAAPPEPTVHVSIGRIEVRASTPPAARGAKPGRPVMTIDDYVARKKDRR